MRRQGQGYARRLGALVMLCALLAGVDAARADHAVVAPYPDALQIEVCAENWTLSDGTKTEVDLPVTCDAGINAALREAMDELWRDAAAHAQPGERIDMQATYRVSGTSWAGFLLLGRVVRLGENETHTFETEQTAYLCYDVLSYDLATGRPLTLGDVFPSDSAAWESVHALAQERLRAFYAETPRDENALETLCDPDALRTMRFLPCAGKLLITLPLYMVLPGQWQLAQVSLPYPDFRAWMTDAARAQTDNSARPIIALTFDDGPMLKSTQLVLRNLARFGASATFFCIGESVSMWPDLVRRELDYGHSVGSHTMEHKYDYQMTSRELRQDRADCLALHARLLGLEPWLFRAPGGNYQKYVEYQIGWPLIQWRTSAGDTGNNTADQLALHVTAQARDGYIILMHDVYGKTARGAEQFLREFVERGFMFATVDELLYLRSSVVPQPNIVYKDATGEYQP